MFSKSIPALAAAALFLVACSSPEDKAKEELDDFEKLAWGKCKEITEEADATPGTHYCSKVTSMALEMALEDTGLDAAAQKKAIEDWAKSSEYGAFYADETAREAIPD
ncbi:hypothetical protein G6O69_31705 [Pseudenhygromyxa sp. WMMC2535]|uniref:hypothetical protein n=1 Tax=Pseudenhygromyxa sp. WMMC2535 TaxID=2712867 RepID=UPI00155338D8|nr:hypothetical protein [Pseudenhygromyxa sp. WMMC2535]NVB42432.1 hypothetical protein [Pseudenhygromyxa sp. WMMC2535]